MTLDAGVQTPYVERLMALSLDQQALELIRQSNHTLICFPEAVSGDGLATSLGLALALERLRPGHQIDVVSSGFADAHRARYRFLPGIDHVRSNARREETVRIRIPCDDPNACDIRHAVRNGAMEIELTARGTALHHEHIETALDRSAYDCIIIIDCPDLGQLGSLYTDHVTLFQAKPIITLDHAPDHERYGHVQVIDLTASACGEVAARFLERLAPECVDADVATCLLAGILAETRSFRSLRMSPSTFGTTSSLLERGARREEIVAALFQTKTVGQLQLWGRALTRLRTDRDRKLVWTILSQHDFLAAGAAHDDLPDIIDDLLANAPDAQCIILVCEKPDRTIGVTAAAPSGRYDAAALLRTFGGAGSTVSATATLPAQPLLDAERIVLDAVRQRLPTV